MDERARAEELLTRVGRALAEQKRRGRLLDDIAWPRETEEEFFASGCGEQPRVAYRIDRDGLEARVADLDALAHSIDGDEPVADWLRRLVGSHRDADAMLLAAGTRRFGELARDLYGGARTPFYEGNMTNLDLAEHLERRLRVHGWDEAKEREQSPLGAEEMAEFLGKRIARTNPRLDVEVTLDPGCTAKVLAGARRVRVRPDATFGRTEAEGLFFHEVETHALTAQNGGEQRDAPFLASGGPRTTRTQEGLAVFSELYHHVLTVPRLARLALRVRLVDMAEQGASFLDLYRHLVDGGAAPREAYLDAQRICRGGLVEGGAPFTKDACYLAGLLHVVAFLNVFVRGGFRDETELLVVGRVDLDDVTALVKLRSLGLLSRPRYLPRWLRRWDTLLPYFAFSSFVQGLDLSRLEAHCQDVIRLSEQAAPGPKRRTERRSEPDDE